MKKFLSAVIACTLAASMLTTPAFALSANYSADDSTTVMLSGDGDDTENEVFTENDYRYSITDGKAVVKGYDGSDTVLNIPSKLGGKKVEAIGDDAFKGKRITGFSLPGSVTEIGNGAFEG